MSDTQFCPLEFQMKRQPAERLAVQREAFRLWFEYLKLARTSTNAKIKSALVVSSPYYAPWEMDKAGKFDEWWKGHKHLFEEKHFVRTLQAGEAPSDPTALVIEVPLTQSPTLLTKQVKLLIQAAHTQLELQNKKSKRKPTAYYKLSDGSEPKLDAVREMLSVYRDVHLKHPKLRGEKLLLACHRYYLGRKNKRWAKIPVALMYNDPGDDLARAMRNLRRYLQKAEKVVLNVARGQFPGPM